MMLMIILKQSEDNKMIIYKDFEFDMAHRLDEYNGLCKNIHGHIYKLTIGLNVSKLDKLGISIDFKMIREVVNENIIKYVDHSLWLKDSKNNEKLIKLLKKEKNRLLLTPYNSTAENMALTIWHILHKKIPMYTVTLFETPTSRVTVNHANYEAAKKSIVDFEFSGEE